MKRLGFLLALSGLMPVALLAQDDMYYTPKKVEKRVESGVGKVETPTYYRGLDKDVDEYNRRGKFRSVYKDVPTDSLGRAIEGYEGDDVLYPDSSYVGSVKSSKRNRYDWEDEADYYYSRRMSRFYDPWFFGYYGYYPHSRFGWYDPFYDGYWGGYYSGWYSSWGYPYYGYGWGSPYYSYGYPYYGYYGHYGWYGPRVVYTQPRRVDIASRRGEVRHYGSGTFAGVRSSSTRSARSSQRSYNGYNDNRFGGIRSNESMRTPTRSYTPSMGSGSGGSSFGSIRSMGGGGSAGGSSSGGRFGGRR